MIKMQQLIKIVDNFKGKKIGVIGDLVLDHFIRGDVERISPEAPVPVVLISKEDFIPGGAANTANNINALGGEAFIVGLVGFDIAGNKLTAEMKKRRINTDGILIDKNRFTTQKTRVVSQNQQIVRFDREITGEINRDQEKKGIDFISSHIKYWDGLVISDYNKGFMTKSLAEKIIQLSEKYRKPIIVDTKPAHAYYFKNITLLTPNSKEAIAMSGTSDTKKAGRLIQKRLNCNVLIKKGAQGMTLFEGDGIKNFPTKAKEVFDVVGAGDTVGASLILSLVAGANLSQAAIIANHAAGIVVGKVGTAVVFPKELKEDIASKSI